jgi:hypothetical protein
MHVCRAIMFVMVIHVRVRHVCKGNSYNNIKPLEAGRESNKTLGSRHEVDSQHKSTVVRTINHPH